MATQPPLPFGALLRRHRVLAGLTQEALASRAGLSVRAISDLERGVNRTPQPATLLLLAEALQLSAADRAVFEETARTARLAARALPSSLTLPEPSDGSQVTVPKTANQGLQLPLSINSKTVAGIVSGMLVIAVLVGAVFLTGVPRVQLGQPSSSIGGLLCLATDLPTSGTDGAPAESVQRAIDLAVLQNQRLGLGYTLKAINYNDVSPQTGRTNPSTGAQNVLQMVRNPCVVGMVGPYDSAVAAVEMPIAAQSGLVMISPTNTNPALTLRTYAPAFGWDFDQLHPPGKKINYFRVSPNDVTEGLVDADFIFGKLGARQVYLVNDSTPYGEQLASCFAQAFQEEGGAIVESGPVLAADASSIARLAADIVAKRPDAVFYAGWTGGGGGLLKGELDALGYALPFVSGDGVEGDPLFLAQVVAQGKVTAANDIYASNPFPDLSTFKTGKAAQFIHDYAARYTIQDLSSYAADGYDAAMVLITAIKQLIRSGLAVTRAAVIDRVKRIQYNGVTGPISFDTDGDIVHGVFSIYKAQANNWVYFQQITT